MNELKNDIIYLRPISLDDAKEFFDYAKIYDFGPKADWAPHSSILETKAIIKALMKEEQKGISKNFVIRRISDNKMLGTIELFKIIPGFKAEAGFSIRPDENNKGYATCALNLLINYGFEKFGLKRIEAISFKENKASQRVCLKCGFKIDGILENAYQTYDLRIVDVCVMSITR